MESGFKRIYLYDEYIEKHPTIDWSHIYFFSPELINEFNSAFVNAKLKLIFWKYLKESDLDEIILFTILHSYSGLFALRFYLNYLSKKTSFIGGYEIEEEREKKQKEEINNIVDHLSELYKNKLSSLKDEDSEALDESNLFIKFDYPDKYHEQIIRLLYSRLNNIVFQKLSFEEFMSHFSKTNKKIKKINWIGTQPQIVTLFEGLKISNSKKYKMIESHFYDFKNKKPFKHRQLSVVSQKLSKKRMLIISDLLEEIIDLVKS